MRRICVTQIIFIYARTRRNNRNRYRVKRVCRRRRSRKRLFSSVFRDFFFFPDKHAVVDKPTRYTGPRPHPYGTGGRLKSKTTTVENVPRSSDGRGWGWGGGASPGSSGPPPPWENACARLRERVCTRPVHRCGRISRAAAVTSSPLSRGPTAGG